MISFRLISLVAVVVAWIVETTPTIEGVAVGTADDGATVGEILGWNVGEELRKDTQIFIKRDFRYA